MGFHLRIGYQKPFIVCGWLFLFCGSVFSQGILSSVEISGNSFFSERELLQQIPSRAGSPVTTLERTKELLAELYQSEGFYAFSIDSVSLTYRDDPAVVSAEIFLNERERTLVSSIGLSGNTVLPTEELIRSFETEIGAPLRSSVLESDIRTILLRYSQEGYPFASVRSDSIEIDTADRTSLSVHLIITEGSRVVLEEVRVEGNTVTSPEVIAREAALRKGELYDERRMERIKGRLERTQLFSSVADPQLYIISERTTDPLRAGLLLTVAEGNSNTFDGILGYVPPPAQGGQGYFTGNVFVAFRNLFGTGRRSLIRWMRETQITQELELHYREPWIFGIPLSAGGTFFQRKQDSSFVKSRIDLRVELVLSEGFSVAANILSENVIPSADRQQFTVFESRSVFAGAELLYDTRDNIRNTTSGVRYSTSAQQGTKKITGPQQYLSLTQDRNLSVRKFTIDAETFLPTFNRQVMMIGVHGRQITSTQLELSDLFQFGGSTTLRGYRENQFFASQIAYINLEYRFLTGRASSFFGFFDAGYLSRPADVFTAAVRQEQSLRGFGLGARIETGLGIMNISYALGKGDSFSNGKIHVGIINEF